MNQHHQQITFTLHNIDLTHKKSFVVTFEESSFAESNRIAAIVFYVALFTISFVAFTMFSA